MLQTSAGFYPLQEELQFGAPLALGAAGNATSDIATSPFPAHCLTQPILTWITPEFGCSTACGM